MTYMEACAAYRAARHECERIEALADRAFVRWFTGETRSAAAAARLANRANYLSADLAGAEIAVYTAADDLGFVEVDLDAIYENEV